MHFEMMALYSSCAADEDDSELSAPPGQVRGWIRTRPTHGRDEDEGVEVGELRKVG